MLAVCQVGRSSFLLFLVGVEVRVVVKVANKKITVCSFDGGMVHSSRRGGQGAGTRVFYGHCAVGLGWM